MAGLDAIKPDACEKPCEVCSRRHMVFCLPVTRRARGASTLTCAAAERVEIG